MSTDRLSEGTAPASQSHFRGRGAVIVLGVAALLHLLNFLVLVASREDTTHGIFTAIYVLLPAMVLGLLVWWTFFSGLTLRARGIGLGVVAAAALLFVALVRTDGVDGVMVPQFSWRWTKSAEERAREYRESQAALGRAALTTTAASNGAGEGEAAPAANGDPNAAAGDGTTPANGRIEITDADWPRFRGPKSDGVVRGVTLRTDWNENPPREVWRHPCGLGWSSFSIVGNRLYTQEQIGEDEAVVCYDADTGRELWRHNDRVRLDTSLGGDGPRATPTIQDSKVYALGGTGLLNCLDAVTGERLWTADILADAGIEGIDDAWIDWGMSGSPLIDERYVYVNAGISKREKGDSERDQRKANGAVAAYDRLTGKKVWGSGNSKAGYASPLFAEFHGMRQLVIFDAEECAGYDPDTGERLWARAYPNSQRINVAQPLPVGDNSLVISAGYAKGSLRFKVLKQDDGWSVKDEWEKPNYFKLKFNDGVFRDGFIYGLDEGILACLDARTGERTWREGRYRYGEIVMVAGDSPADDLIVVLSERGELVLVKASPEKPVELGKFEAITGTCWNHPVVNRGRIYVRSEQEMACFEAGE